VFHSCSSSLVAHSISIKTGPSNTFVIRQSQRLNVFTTNDLNYPTRPVIIALAHRQSTFTLPPPISSYSFPACSWTVSVSCRLSHSSLSRLVRLLTPREKSFAGSPYRTTLETPFSIAEVNTQITFNTHHHACHQKRSSRQAGQDRAFPRREPGEVCDTSTPITKYQH
jgi:hypothetical protein